MVKSVNLFQLNESEIAGVFELIPKIHEDVRGKFVKVYHKPNFESLGLECDFIEEYYSISHKNVLRGMHFQLPPHDLKKLVYCVEGEVLDVVVDLRKKSATYGKHIAFNLNEKQGNMIYIPEGLAHGFYVKSSRAIMVYKTTSVYSQESDYGVRYDSIGFNWACKGGPILSSRDQSLPCLGDLESPF